MIKYLEKEKPDLVFSTHFLCSQAIDYVRKKHDLKFPLVNMHTDIFAVFSLWVIKGVDYYIASSNLAKKELLKRGLDENNFFFRQSERRRQHRPPPQGSDERRGGRRLFSPHLHPQYYGHSAMPELWGL